MASADGKNVDSDDPLEPSSPPPHMHSVAFSGMPMHMYPFPPSLLPSSQGLRSKRRQVKNACTNCQKPCKKCDDARPCLRCVKYGVSEECVDSQRKERKKGIKRGPYKKRDGKGNSIDQADIPQQGMPVSNMVPTPGGSAIMAPYLPIGYPPAFYGQYHPTQKHGDGQAMYSSPQYFLAPVPHVQHQAPGLQDGDNHGYQTQGFYQATVFAPVAYPHYVMPRSDGQVHVQNQYAVFGAPVFSKTSLISGSGEMVHERAAVDENHSLDGATDNSG